MFIAHFPGLEHVTERELHGPCPVCGGTDRFRVVRTPAGVRGYCRPGKGHCGQRGDFAQWLMHAGMSRTYPDALAFFSALPDPVTTSFASTKNPAAVIDLPSRAERAERADFMYLARRMSSALNSSALEYLGRRGIFEWVAREFMVGVTSKGRLSLPWLSRSGDRVHCERIQTRALRADDPVRYSIMPGGSSILPHGHGMRCWSSADVAVLCEGELDFLAVQTAIDETHMRTHIVALTRGSAAATWCPEDLPPGVKRVICAFDADDAGDEGADRLRDVLPPHVAYVRMRPASGDVGDMTVAERMFALAVGASA